MTSIDDGERAMWAAVIEQAVRDASKLSWVAPANERVLVRNSAARWLKEAGPDFREVCDMAGIDPDAVQARYANGI